MVGLHPMCQQLRLTFKRERGISFDFECHYVIGMLNPWFAWCFGSGLMPNKSQIFHFQHQLDLSLACIVGLQTTDRVG